MVLKSSIYSGFIHEVLYKMPRKLYFRSTWYLCTACTIVQFGHLYCLQLSSPSQQTGFTNLFIPSPNLNILNFLELNEDLVVLC